MRRSSLLVALLTICVLCVVSGPVEPPGGAEFPLEDGPLWTMQRTGLEAKLAARRLAQAPDSVDTLEALLQAKRLDDALRVVRRIVDRRPDRIAEAFRAVLEVQSDITRDVSHGYADALQDVVVAARARVAALPREPAARAARRILSVDRAPLAALNAPPEADRIRLGLAAFVSEYRDTEAGALAEIELVSRSISVQALEQFDRIAAAHPGTTIAAAALSAKGSALATNPYGLGERAVSDPTDRFFRVLEIAKELESGRFPSSQWVSTAPYLVFHVFANQPQYQPGNLERVLEANIAYLAAHLRLGSDDASSASVRSYIINTLPNLLESKGDAVTGVEGVLTRLESNPESRDAVRYVRALFYLQPRGRRSEEERRVLRHKAQQLRAARCEWLLGNPNAAAQAFRSAAVRYRSIPVEPLFDYAYAARADVAARADRNRGPHDLLRRVDHVDVAGGRHHIQGGAVRGDRQSRWTVAHGEGLRHRIGGRIDHRDGCRSGVGHVGTSAIARDRDPRRIGPDRNNSRHRPCRRVDDRDEIGSG